MALCLLESFPEETAGALENPSLDKTTALYWACRNGLHQVVSIFLQRHPDLVTQGLRQRDSEGRTGLSYACQNGHEQAGYSGYDKDSNKKGSNRVSAGVPHVMALNT